MAILGKKILIFLLKSQKNKVLMILKIEYSSKVFTLFLHQSLILHTIKLKFKKSWIVCDPLWGLMETWCIYLVSNPEAADFSNKGVTSSVNRKCPRWFVPMVYIVWPEFFFSFFHEIVKFFVKMWKKIKMSKLRKNLKFCVMK